MLLATHLKAKGFTDQEFADLIGCDRSFVTRLRNGENNVSFKLMQKIEEVTGGQVTAFDIYAARKDRLAVKSPRKSKSKSRSKSRVYLHAAE